MDSKEFAERITSLIFDKKGTDVKIIAMNKVSTIADYFVICSAESDTQVKAIADNVEKTLRDEGIRVWHREGYQALRWVLLDFVDVVVHIFHDDARKFYSLEKLWGDAEIIDVEDPLKEKKVES